MRYWLTTREGTVTGPHPVKELQRLQSKGEIDGTSMICAEGSRDWTAAEWVLRQRATSLDHLSQTRDLRASITLLRVLIVTELALNVVSVIAVSLDEALGFSQPLIVDESGDFTSLELLLLCTIFPYLLLALVSYIGLFLFQPWARWTYTGVAGLGTLLSVLASLHSTPEPFEAAFGSLNYLTTGAIVVTLFFTPVAQKFEPQRLSGP